MQQPVNISNLEYIKERLSLVRSARAAVVKYLDRETHVHLRPLTGKDPSWVGGAGRVSEGMKDNEATVAGRGH